MNINPNRIKYLSSLAAVAGRQKAAEAQAVKENKHVRLARITNGAHPDYRNGTPYPK